MLRRKKLGHFPYENLPVWSDVGDDFLICAKGSGRESNPRSSVLSGLVKTESQGQQEACGISALRAHGQVNHRCLPMPMVPSSMRLGSERQLAVAACGHGALTQDSWWSVHHPVFQAGWHCYVSTLDVYTAVKIQPFKTCYPRCCFLRHRDSHI